jgi:cephalosporin hydroxylase
VKDSLSYHSYLRSPYRSIKHSTYFEAYDDLFSKYRNMPITFVEIGILGGGSLFMWRDFFGPEARIIGIDLHPGAKKWEEHGFEILIGSQSDEHFWRSFRDQIGPVDIVLDDGGHTFEQQIVTTENLLPCIKDGGLLVVEDTHTSYMPGFGPMSHSFIEYVKKFIDRINVRFGELESPRADRRTWSIQIYESIVAFHVNRRASELRSQPTENGGARDLAEDFRDFDNRDAQAINAAANRFGLLKALPGVKPLGRRLRKTLVDSRVKARISRFF